jgi:hypothetical protein
MSKDIPADPVTMILGRLLSDKANMDALIAKYQDDFNGDPIGVIERLLKLLPKDAREEMGKMKKKPLGLFIVMSGEKPKAKGE